LTLKLLLKFNLKQYGLDKNKLLFYSWKLFQRFNSLAL
jgi:hypothetical protein